jgi:hypothetical protein
MSLWDERLPGESIKAWAAFTIYRDLPIAVRSISAAWRKWNQRTEGDAPNRWMVWSGDHRWVERSAAYAEHLDAKARTAREQRFIDLAVRQADHELVVQDQLEELERWQRANIEKHNAAPITDIVRIEEKEVTVTGTGQLKVVAVTTKVRGMRVAALARLSQEYRSTMQQAVLGVRPQTDAGEAPLLQPKADLPEFMRRAMEDDHADREQRKLEAARLQLAAPKPPG